MAKEVQELTYEDRKAIMDKYHSGDPFLKDEAVQEMLAALDKYIYYLMNKRFAGYMNSMKEDMEQSGKMAIIEYMGNYNPEYKLTTYFSFHIQNALQELVNKENGESHYYAESKNIIVKTMRQLGMDFENIDEQVLAMNLNMTVGRLRSILEKTVYKKKVELIEEDGDTSIGFSDSPEATFMRQEMQREFRECIKLLDEVEQIVICMHFGFPHDKFNIDENIYKLSEIQKVLTEAGYDVNAINVYRAARRHIGVLLQKTGIVGKKNKYQSAKEEIGLRFRDDKVAEEMFDALNEINIDDKEGK